MKKIVTSLCFIAIVSQAVLAQNNNLIIYSQEGLRFSVILNGVRQNSNPETNVKITGLNATNYQVKIIFNNKAIPDLDQNTYLIYGGEQTQNTEFTYAISKVKDKYKLKFKSTAPIPEITDVALQQTTVEYSPVEQVSTTRSTTTTTNTNGSNMGVNLNTPGIGVSMNINVNDVDMGNNMNSTTTTTTTHSTSTTVSNGGSPNNNNAPYVLEGYSGVYGCPYPMTPRDFESAKASVKAKAFDDSKLTIAKQIIGSNCMLCSQIKELMLLITFEQTRLELAKFAWHHNLDRGNYYKLNDAFTFESSIDELNQYTQSH